MSATDPFLNNLMMQIPGGTETLRDDRTRTQWEVAVAPFRLARFQVTQAFFLAVCGSNPSVFQNPLNPVESLSWMDAIRFCNALSDLQGLDRCYRIPDEPQRIEVIPDACGFRLPSEAEWQFACKAGGKAICYAEPDQIAWYRHNSGGSPKAVGLKEPNAFGLYDMLGNVWEWCNDLYDESVYGSYRVFRGGGWNDPERSIVAVSRRRSHPSAFKIDDLGFRIAQNALF